MTNAEKFENVFGYKPNKNLCYAPEDVECPPDCGDCLYISWLNDEYTAEPKQGKWGGGMTEIVDFLKKYTNGKRNTEKVEISVLQLNRVIKALEQGSISDKYEYHIDHTDCIWYGSDSGCPATCSQYRDGWNDAMEYIFKGGKGYQPYRRGE